MLSIDVSLSMEATDVTPNRLAAAQQAATQFVHDLTPGINLGILSFAGTATVLVSATTDRASAVQVISGLKLDRRTATGKTIIACPQTIAGFPKLLSNAEGTTGPVLARIVMMTDGKRTVGSTKQDADTARDRRSAALIWRLHTATTAGEHRTDHVTHSSEMTATRTFPASPAALSPVWRR